MPNWTSNTAPNYYKDLGDERSVERPYHPNDAGSLFLTDKGWERQVVYTDQHGRTRTKSYVEVADREAATDSSVIFITDIRVASSGANFTATPPTIAAGVVQWLITFNQAVTVNHPTETGNVWETKDSSAATGIATYVSGSGTNQILVQFDATSLLTGATVGLTAICKGVIEPVVVGALPLAVNDDASIVNGGRLNSSIVFDVADVTAKVEIIA